MDIQLRCFFLLLVNYLPFSLLAQKHETLSRSVRGMALIVSRGRACPVCTAPPSDYPRATWRGRMTGLLLLDPSASTDDLWLRQTSFQTRKSSSVNNTVAEFGLPIEK